MDINKIQILEINIDSLSLILNIEICKQKIEALLDSISENKYAQKLILDTIQTNED